MCQFHEKDLNTTIAFIRSNNPHWVTNFFKNGYVPIDPKYYIKKCTGECFKNQSDQYNYAVNSLAWDVLRKSQNTYNHHNILDGKDFTYPSSFNANISMSHAIEVSIGN
jgi:hypothetical protein